MEPASRSEEFWIWIIEQTIASLLDNPRFALEDADLPYVSGHSVSEHLQYGIEKYCPDQLLEQARQYYFEHTHRELTAILNGAGRPNAFTPTPGLKPFLLALKARGIKIGLVTSGLYEKALSGDCVRIPGAGYGRSHRVLRRDHHRRISAAGRINRDTGGAFPQAASLAVCRNLPRGVEHTICGTRARNWH
jgi:hypothetical protein